MQSYKNSLYFSKNEYEMTEEREIAGFVLPLAAGIAACSTITSTFPSAGAGISGLLLAFVLLWIGWKHRCDRGPVLVASAAAAFFTGLFLFSTWSMSHILHPFEFPSIRGSIDLNFPHEETNGLLNALITGNKSELSKNTISAFRNSGAAHLLALSGLHLGLLYAILQKLLLLLGRSLTARRIRWFLLLLLAGSYTLATGASPSLVRAFLFIVLNETSRLTGRPQRTAQILMSALTLQLLLTPAALLTTGFQLSYLAVGGIIYIYPLLERCWPDPEDEDRSWMRKVWKSACLSISCQLTTSPLAWIRFGSMPEHFLLTNLLAIPLTGLLIPIALLTIILEASGCCPDFLLLTVDRLASALIRLLELISVM